MKEAVKDPRFVEYVSLADAKAADVNPKLHDLGEISVSIKERGFVELPVIDERTGQLVAGHGRFEALAAMKKDGQKMPAGLKPGDKGEWLVPVVKGWRSKNAADAAAYLIGSNRLTTLGGWDDGVLTSLLTSIVTESGPGGLIGTGYDGDDIDKFLNDAKHAAAGLTDPDAVPDVKVVTVKLGDLFRLGDHRILCGDSTKPESAARVLGDRKAQCVWTDPPYGVEYEGKTKAKLTIINDGASGLPALLKAVFAACFNAMEPGAHIYVAHPPGELSMAFYDAFRAAGFKFKQQLVWDKTSMVLGHSDYHYRHEPIIYGMKPGAEGRRGRGGVGWYGDNAQTSVLTFPKPQRSDEHPTMKPIELVEACLTNSTAPGHVVFEPFSGSGTTLLACERLGRHCAAIELDPRFVQVALERWEAFTGKKAEKMGS